MVIGTPPQVDAGCLLSLEARVRTRVFGRFFQFLGELPTLFSFLPGVDFANRKKACVGLRRRSLEREETAGVDLRRGAYHHQQPCSESICLTYCPLTRRLVCEMANRMRLLRRMCWPCKLVISLDLWY